MISQISIPIVSCRRGYYLRWYYNGWHHWNFFPGTVGYLTDGEKYRTRGIRTVELSSGVVGSDEIDAIRSILNARECYVYTDGGWSECRVESGAVGVQRNSINAYELQCKIRIGSRNISSVGYSVGVNKNIEIPFVPIPGDVCELEISGIGGSQTWLCKNWNAGVYGSKWYDNDIANREIYGGLYTWAQIHEPGFCPAGWHIPTASEWNVLYGILINLPGWAEGGLKATGFEYWDAPNTGATDFVGWDGRGSGRAFILSGQLMFDDLKQGSHYWLDETFGGRYEGYLARMYNNSTTINVVPNLIDNLYASVRLIKDTP